MKNQLIILWICFFAEMKKIFIVLIGMTMALPPVFAATWYVSPNGNDGNSGAIWALAKKTIQAGVDVASDGDTVLVTNGTYVLTNQIAVINGITVKSVNGASKTIVNGNYPVTINRCFSLNNNNAILDGFTITGGYYNGFSGGGVYNDGTVQNCIISGNTAAGGDYGAAGGGVYNGGTVQNCIISGNTAGIGTYGEGGGVYNDGTVQNCTISGNTGGGVYNDGAVQNCIISGNNTAGSGGGVLNINSQGTVQNCTISGNTAGGNGGGVFNFGTVQNCTISGNTAGVGSFGGGVYNYGTIQNCIVYYNENEDVMYIGGNASYSCAPELSGNGNIADDPQFINPGSGYGSACVPGDYRLKPYSPCINTGTNQTWMTNAVDMAGNPRIINSIVDIGACESTDAVVTRIATPANVSASKGTFADKVQVTWSDVTGADGYIVYRNTESNANLSESVSFQPALSPYNDMNALTGSNYYYWVVAKNLYGNSLLSSSAVGYRRELDIDLTGVAAVFIDNNYKLFKVLTNGTVTNLCSTNYSASHMLRSPQGYVFIGGLSPEVRMENDNYYQLIKINPTNNVVIGIDTSLQNMAWGTISPSIQLDQDENIYYLANQNDGALKLKKWINPTNIVSMINDNISISQWLVNPDGTILMGGNTESTSSSWFRKLTPDMNLYSLATSINVPWLLLFPDNRVYASLDGGTSTNYYGVYRLLENLSSLDSAELYSLSGTYISRYWKTTDDRIFALQGSVGNYTILQLYPTVTNIVLSTLDRITLAEPCLNMIVAAGTKDENYRLILYDVETKAEVTLLDENIEIYHLQILSNRTIWLDGLKFAGNRYIIGKIVLTDYGSGMKSLGSATFTEIATISGKPIDFIKIEADPVSTTPTIGPVIKANDSTNDITIGHSDNLSITVQLNPGQYSGVPVDWWVIACAGSTWYYLDSVAGWREEGSSLNWHPAHQGALFSLPAYEVLNITGLGTGSYTLYFAIDLPMDGILNYPDGPILVDSVNVLVQ